MAGDDDRGDRPPASTDLDRGHRWECPVCDLSRVNRLSDEGRNAVRALRAHVYLADGDGHGESGSFPDGLGEDELDEYVEPHDEME